MPRTMLKSMALVAVAGALALTWTQSGRAASSCVVERGIDPLDVLNVAVRHNVWIAVDNSGSMSQTLDGQCIKSSDLTRDCLLTGPSPDPAWDPSYSGRNYDHPASRLAIAKAALTDIISSPELNDANGAPLVNWGLVYTESQDDDLGTNGTYSCSVPQVLESGGDISNNGNPSDGLATECVGLDPDRTTPSQCTDTTSKEIILAKLKLSTETTFVPGVGNVDGIKNNGGTANSSSMAQTAQMIKENFMSNLKPGQKNFIIYVSDGAEDCECEGNTITLPPGFVGASNLAPGLRVDRNDPNVIQSVSSSKDRRFYNAGIKGRFTLETIDPNLDGSLGDVFVIFFAFVGGSGEKNASHWSWESSGYGWTSRPLCGPGGGVGCARGAFFGPDGDSFQDALKRILSQISVPSATVSLGASVVGSVKEVVATHTDPSLMGTDLLASGVADTDVRRLRHKYRNNVLFTTSVTTPGFQGHLRAFNVYQVQTDGSRTADFTEIWDAGEVLRDRLIDVGNDPRRIYFDLQGGIRGQLSPVSGATNGLTDFGVAAGFLWELDPLGVGAKTDDDAVEIVEKVIQGWRLVIDPVNGFYNSSGDLNFSQLQGGAGTWKLFDATLSTPAVVLNPPRSPDVDPPQPTLEYTNFYDDQINRMTVVYLGTNGGMVHAFRADNGYEIYGYIPHDLLPELPNLVRNVVARNNGLFNHEFFIASSAVVQDAYLQDAPSGSPEWRTVLAFGRGAGGKFLTALDITDVGEWDGSSFKAPPTGSQPPQLLFTVGNRDGVVDLDVNGENYDGFGETWSLPMIGRVRNKGVLGQWVLFVGGGYGCVGTDEGRYLYVLKLEDGTVYKKLGPIPDMVDGAAGEPGVDQNALVSTPALYNPHEPGINDGKDYITRVYIGDLQGMVHKLDATDPNPAKWEFGVFFEVTSEADQAAGQGEHNQPITAGLAILKLVGSSDIFLFLGTGGDSRMVLTDPDRFKLVGIQDIDNASTIPANNPAFKGNLMLTDAGAFFFDLPPEERIHVAPVVARNTSTNGVVFFASSRSELDTNKCTFNFFSTLFAATVTGGLGAFDLDGDLTGDTSVDLGAGKVAGLFHRDEHLYVSKSGSVGMSSETEVRGKDEFPMPMPGVGNVQVLVEGFRLSPF